MKKFFFMVLLVGIALACRSSITFSEEKIYSWRNGEKFLGIRCGLDDDNLLHARELGLNTVLITDGFVLEPAASQYEEKIAELKHSSKLAKKFGLQFFMSWQVLGSKAREITYSHQDNKSRGSGRSEMDELCVSDPIYWDQVFAGPMRRVTEALAGPEYQLDGFLLDIENYARGQVQWTGRCALNTHSMGAVRTRVERTRKALEAKRSGLIFGLYPIKPKIRRPVLIAWLQGLSDSLHPVMLLTEYTYEGYRPEWELEKKYTVYSKRIGNPVVLVPGFNWVIMPEPSAWKMHLYSFAKAADGYWLYPGNRLIRKVSSRSNEGSLAYASIKEANREIERLTKELGRKSALNYRRQRPDEVDKDQLKDLLVLAREVEPIATSAENVSKARRAVLEISDVVLLVMAGPEEPLDISVKGRGYLAVYGLQGNPLFFEDFGPKGVRVDLSVKSQGVYPAILRDTSGKRARISIANRYWSFRGSHVWTVGGRKARFLSRPRQSPLYFYVPRGTQFFRMFLSDPKRGSLALIRDSDGKQVLEQKAGFLKGDRQHARQDVEITVPPGQDGKVWSVEGIPMSGLPRLVIYGVPDLFNPDPDRLLILDDKTIERHRQILDRKRLIEETEPAYLWIEAEELNGGPWRLSRAIPGTSRKGAMFAKGFRSTLPLYGEVLIPHSGRWKVWVRALLGTKVSKKRSMIVEINGFFLRRTHTGAVQDPAYTWEDAGKIDLDAGRKMLKIHASVGGRPSVDVVVLTDNLSWIPEGFEKP
jgi:hypothetical protein